MKTVKIIREFIALTAILISMIGWAGDSGPFLLDTTDPLITAPITYNSSWIGDESSAEVVISADGTEIKRTTGEGEFAWSPTTAGKHTLTYTTYIDGVAQEEVYTTTVFKDWKYTVDNGKATIVETTQKSGSVTIPSEIDGSPVVGLDEGLFKGCEGLTSVTIPDSVASVGKGAFDGCASLENVEISESVTDIGTGAFSGCAAMADDDGYLVIRGVLYGYFGDDNCVTVPDGVAVIDPKAFYGCDALTSVTMPLEILGGTAEQTPQVEKNNWIEGEGGVYQSNDINDRESTSMTMEVEGPLDFTFDWKVSSESSCDELKCYLDGSQISEISGMGNGWQTINYFIPEGSHTLRWEYSKDSGVSNGDDCGWVRITELVSTSITMASLFPDSYTVITNVVLTGDGERIPQRAFAGCASLQNVVIPDGITTIGVRAFEGCEALSKITIPDDVTTIGKYAFNGCSALTEIVIPDSVDKIGENVFKDCTNLKSITIRLSVEGAAENLPNDVPLTLILDNNDQRLPDRLRNCVRKVIFSDGITRIADDFFLDCNNLETIDIPQSVVAIGRNVFNFCSSLNIVTQDGFKLYQGWCLGYEGADNSTLKIPEGVLGVASEAFKGMTSLKNVTFPISLRFIGADAFAGCTQLAELTLPDNIVEIADGAFRDCTWVQNVKMSSNLERIGAAAFANCAYLPNIVCADGLEEIGVGAFSNCWRMTSVSLPASLDIVGHDAFWNCKNLGGVTVPAHVQPLAEMFPASYSTLSSIVIAEGETELCEGAFEGCAGVSKIDIPETITNIPSRAFKNCTNFDRLVLPSGLLAIGDEAFYGCSKIGSLTLPESLTSIGAGAFNGWALLDVVTIPDGVAFIGSGAFAGCAAVRQVRMPSNVATVSATFPDAYTEIVRVTIPNNSTAIIAGFLNGCTSITSFDIPLSVTEIGDNAFRGCNNLSGITLPNGLEKIGSYAFYGCTLINDLTIPFSVTSIGNNAFGSCAQIRSVVISGEAGTLSSLFPNAYQQIVSVTVIPGSEKLMNRIFAGCKSLKNVDIPTSVTEIGEGAFENCTALTSAGIPAGVTVLGKGAFRGCSTLMEITLPNGLSVLEDEVFSGCSLLSAITIPESVAEIGSKVFDGCTALHSVKFVGNAPLADVESYIGVSSSLITYVPYASMGWDGISTSMALPEFWPAGYENTIEWWNPIRFDVTFDWNCGNDEADVLEQVVDTTYLLPDVDPTREGATFVGWWTAKADGARITPASRVMLTTPHTLYAHWRMNTYSVVFDANGGIGAMEPMDLTVNKPAVLTACGFTRFDSDFAGWAIEPEGEVLYRDCAEVSNLTLESDAVVTLYAVWTPRTWTEGDYLNQPGFTFIGDGNEPWVTDAEVSHDGIGSLRSGAIGASAEYPNRTYSTIKTTVVGEGTGSFWWKVHCEEMDPEYGDWYDYAVFTVDGVEIAKIAGDTDWTKVTYSVTGAGEHELAWTFTRDDFDLEGAEWRNAAWLDELVWSPKMVALKFDAGGATGDVPEAILRQEGTTVLLPGAGTLVKGTDIFKGWSDGTTLYIPGSEYTFGSEDETLTAIWEEKVWTLAEAADAVALVMTTGGAADWTIDATSGYTNTMSVKSGSVTSGQESWIETKVKGAGILTFRWKVMGGAYRNQPFAYAKAQVDNTQIASDYLTDGWEEVVYEITGNNEHTIRWTYLRTSTRAADGDCAWIDAVVWTPAASSDITVDVDGDKNVVVPVSWVDKYESIVTSAGGDKAAALQRTAANGRKVWECFMLGVDPTKADDDFKITRFWMEGGKPMFEFSHSTDGAGNSFTPRIKMKGKAKLSDGWSDVPESGNSAFRFFTVEVALP